MAAMVAMILAIRAPYKDYRFFPIALSFDLAALVILMTTIESPTTGYLAFIVSGVALVIMEVAFRWNIKAAQLVAKLFALVTLCQLALIAAITQAGALPLGVLARRYIILFVILTTVLWALRSLRRIHVTAYDFPQTVPLEALKHMALGHAAKCMGASGGTLCWTPAGEDGCVAPIISLGDAGDAQSLSSRTCTAPRDKIDYAAALVDVPSHQALVLRSDDTIQYQDLAGIDTSAFQGTGHSSGILVRITGGSGHGKLMLSGFPLQGWHNLRVGAALGEEIVRVLDFAALKAATLELETGRLRESIARDLHDSVVQSLAGTRYWLTSLRGTADPQRIATELARIDESLATEQRQIRKMIDILRSGDRLAGHSDALAQLREVSEALTRQWQVEVDVEATSSDFLLPSDRVLELTQMLREAVSNAVRHGGASRVSVGLNKISSGELELRITDNGRGFSDAQFDQPWSLGERVSSLGGTMMLSRERDETHVVLTVPGRAGQ